MTLSISTRFVFTSNVDFAKVLATATLVPAVNLVGYSVFTVRVLGSASLLVRPATLVNLNSVPS